MESRKMNYRVRLIYIEPNDRAIRQVTKLTIPEDVI
jgi:ribosomal protein S10